ncbi:MAG: hypothetical protein ACJAVV_001592 [Alphaproteobacteria bacterium]
MPNPAFGLIYEYNTGRLFINSVLSAQGKLTHAPAHFPFPIEYGYHFDSYLMGEFLSGHSKSLGLSHSQQKIEDVIINTNGNIAAIILENNQKVEGDLFIDCTGFASLLIGKALNTLFESFSDNLFNDAAVVFPTSPLSPLPLETKASALSCGWAWHIPLVNRTSNG